MAEFKPVMIDNADNINTTVGAMNVNIETGDITFISNNGPIINYGSAGLEARIAAIEEKIATLEAGGGGSGGGGINTANIIGVCTTGEYTEDGAVLVWIDKDFNIIDELPENYFDTHPSYQFKDTTFGQDEFVKIPLAYWKRGTVPAGKDLEGEWYMMMSPEPYDDFKPNYVAFMDNSTLKDAFYWSKYRASQNGQAAASNGEGSSWVNISIDDAELACQRMGAEYHVGTAQQYHELLARWVIEKMTFNLVPELARTAYNSNVWRGIHAMAYDDNDGSNMCSSEWRAGVQVKPRSNAIDPFILQVYDQNGNHRYEDTTFQFSTSQNKYSPALLTGTSFDGLFLCDPYADGAGQSSAPPSDATNYLLPDMTSYNGSDTPYVASTNFNSGAPQFGAFYLSLFGTASTPFSNTGFRVARF